MKHVYVKQSKVAKIIREEFQALKGATVSSTTLLQEQDGVQIQLVVTRDIEEQLDVPQEGFVPTVLLEDRIGPGAETIDSINDRSRAIGSDVRVEIALEVDNVAKVIVPGVGIIASNDVPVFIPLAELVELIRQAEDRGESIDLSTGL